MSFDIFVPPPISYSSNDLNSLSLEKYNPMACIILAGLWRQRVKFLTRRSRSSPKTLYYYRLLKDNGYIEEPNIIYSEVTAYYITDRGKAYIHNHLLTTLRELPLYLLEALLLEGDKINIFPYSRFKIPIWTVEGVTPPIGEVIVCEFRKNFSLFQPIASQLVVKAATSDLKFVINIKQTKGRLLIPQSATNTSEIEKRILRPKSLSRFLAYAKRVYNSNSLALIDLSNCFHKASAALR